METTKRAGPLPTMRVEVWYVWVEESCVYVDCRYGVAFEDTGGLVGYLQGTGAEYDEDFYSQSQVVEIVPAHFVGIQPSLTCFVGEGTVPFSRVSF